MKNAQKVVRKIISMGIPEFIGSRSSNSAEVYVNVTAQPFVGKRFWTPELALTVAQRIARKFRDLLCTGTKK